MPRSVYSVEPPSESHKMRSLIPGVRGTRPASLAVLLAIVASSLIAGAAVAATPPKSDYGNTVECRYRADGPGPAYDWRLKRFVVTPPVVFANKAHQMVGWRFVVTRSVDSGGEPWKVAYRSPIQKRMATSTTAADFGTKSVGVSIPKNHNPAGVLYHVTLKLFWYRASGEVQSRQSYVMPWMKWITNGHYYDDYDSICQAGFYEGP